jgi:LuxR family maltose regulon positive regulatory protein
MADHAIEIAAQLGMVDHPLTANGVLALAIVALRKQRWEEAHAGLDLCRQEASENNRWITAAEERIWRAELHRLNDDRAAVKLCLDDLLEAPELPPALLADLTALHGRLLLDDGQPERARRLLAGVPVATSAVRSTRRMVTREPGLFREPLTERELQVLRRLASRKTSAEIGDDLHVSVHTVKTHQRHIYRKLGVPNRRLAVDAAITRGLVDG